MELKSTKILDEKGISYRLIKLSQKGVSFEDVVKYSEDEINPSEICKTIIVKDKKGQKYAFFLKGDKKMDFSKAKEVIGSKISIVSYEDLVKETGIEPGAVCPFLLTIPIFVDKGIIELQKINFGSGDHLYGLEIESKDLKKIIDFKEVDVAQL
ncbi:YbaK/EbsC family protein [Candidatus Pacearchaeota archaeon]|nr:YbaK/EbsC family protein [Candidatus Pacearchaeota archaeon]